MDSEVSGQGNQYDYGFRIYNPRYGKFLSVDPLMKKYPMLTTYQFASNSPISGVDLDGLEFFYAANGEFIGKYGESKVVLLVSEEVSNEQAKIWLSDATYNPSLKCGANSCDNLFLSSSVVYNNHDDFRKMAVVLYAESGNTKTNGVDEVAGIFSVLENRAEYENTSVLEQMTVVKGVNGSGTNEVKLINDASKVGMGFKENNVIAGLIKALNSETDFSNGAYYWDGRDFNKDANPNGGYKERYVPGLKFTDKMHDLFNQGDNKKTGSANGVNWDYKYETSGAIGETTFTKLTEKWRDAQYPSTGKGKQVGNGKE